MITPKVAGPAPKTAAALGPNEIVLEGHDFYLDPSAELPKGRRTFGPGREYGYLYEGDSTTQLDLHQAGVEIIQQLGGG